MHDEETEAWAKENKRLLQQETMRPSRSAAKKNGWSGNLTNGFEFRGAASQRGRPQRVKGQRSLQDDMLRRLREDARAYARRLPISIRLREKTV